jgi:hypothetical protein
VWGCSKLQFHHRFLEKGGGKMACDISEIPGGYHKYLANAGDAAQRGSHSKGTI